jgi:nitroreductase
MDDFRKRVLEALDWRYATQAYDETRKVSLEDMAALEKAMRFAPSSFGLQPYKVIVIEDKSLRERLEAAAMGQHKVAEASHLIVFAAKKDFSEKDIDRFLERVAEVRGQTMETLAPVKERLCRYVQRLRDGGQFFEWAARQAYISLGFLLATAAFMGIDASPMEGFEPARFDEILGLEDYSAVVIAAVGYRDAERDQALKRPKVRPKEEDFFERR